MEGLRHLTWENFRANYVDRGDPAVHVVPGDPPVEVFVALGGASIGLRIAQTQLPERNPILLEHVTSRLIRRGELLFLELACDEGEFFEPFYAMSAAVADLVQLEGVDAVAAVKQAADRFRTFLRSQPAMSEEDILGLWGELWVLEKLITHRGPEALRSWTGPLREPHDFRFGDIELEVKTTRNVEPIHTVNGLAQLQPSPSKTLYLVSLQVGAPGADPGTSTEDHLRKVEVALRGHPDKVTEFHRLISAVGYRSDVEPRSRDAYALRAPATVIPVDESFPRLTHALLSSALGDAVAARITDAVYRVNTRGLGFAESHPAFDAILGREPRRA